MVKSEGSQAGEHGFQREDNRGMIRTGVLLRPHLHGKSQGRAEDSRRDHGQD